MTNMIIEIIAMAVGILVFALFLRQIVLTLKCAFYFFLDIVLNIKQFKGNVNFDIFFLLNKCYIVPIANLKQSKCSEQNSNKPEVYVIFSKGEGLGLQPDVKVNPSF